MNRRSFTTALLAGLVVAAPIVSNAQSGRNRQQQAEEPVPTMTGAGEVAEPTQSGSVRANGRPVVPPPATAVAIAWKGSFGEARKSARSGQLIVVDVYTDWCGWCKVMDRKVYADAAVVKYASKHVFVKANAEDGGPGSTIARENGVTSFPTTLIFSSDGKLLEKRMGAFQDPNAFVSWVDTHIQR